MTRLTSLAAMTCGLLVLATSSGCSRMWWREQADDAVAAAITEKNGYLDHGDVLPDADSRLADPFSIDEPPLPPDDPTSHQLMHEVNGKRGFDWHRHGEVPAVDLQQWMGTLPQDSEGNIVLNLAETVRVARKHSREYQTELEDLYLSALDVTFERFRFDTQFFLGNTTNETLDGQFRSGKNDSSTLNSTTSADLKKLTATGGELAIGLANSLVWQFSGKNSDTLGSTLDFTLMQPLLRFGGRARVLERLTQSERTLVANVRQMEQFRQGFYVQIVAGRNSGQGPVRRGDVGQGGLGLIAGLPSGRSGAAPVGGFIGLLQEQQQIRNRVANLTALRDSYMLLEALFEAGRLPNRLQVDQTRQAYFNAQSNLLTTQAGYASRIDSFKMSLGLPPSLPIDVKDQLIDQFNLIEPLLVDLQDDLNDILMKLRKNSIPPEQIGMPERRNEILGLKARVDRHFELAAQSLDVLKAEAPKRLAQLQRLKARIPDLKMDVDMRVFEPKEFEGRLRELDVWLPRLRKDTAEHLASINTLTDDVLKGKPKDRLEDLIELGTKFSGDLVDLMLLQASIRLETTDLMPMRLSETQALDVARNNRLDWMNARANLVDAWRKIEFDANALQSDLNLVISGDISTKEDNIAEFRKENGRLRFGVEFDTPVTRLAERNQYRETLIEYQRARRDYMLFEDQVSQSLRNTLRIVDQSQLNFEIRRAAVRIAISQVGLARYRLIEPAKGGAQAVVAGQSQISPTTARDLVSALNDLLDAQNDFLNAWVSYEVLRMLLDFELGTMQLSPEGMWIDRGVPVPEAQPVDDVAPPVIAPAPPAAAQIVPPKIETVAAVAPKPNDAGEGDKSKSRGWRATQAAR